MIHLHQARDAIAALLDLDGWVIAVILALAVLSGAVVLWKLVPFRVAGRGWAGTGRDRLHDLAGERLARLESGSRLLDAAARIAPLPGLFGTVLGMIDAFRAIQAAGQDADPSVPAGGIGVALTTTAAGRALAMPVTLVLSWLTGRVAAERRLAEALIDGALAPGMTEAGAADPLPWQAAHA